MVRVRIDLIPAKGLQLWQTCHRQRLSLLVATTTDNRVRVVVTRLTGTTSHSGRCLTAGISTCGARVISWSSLRSTTAPKWRKYGNADLSDLAPPGSHYTHRVIDLAVRLVVEDGLPYRPARWHLWRDHRVFVPFATIQNWVEAGGKKGAGTHGHRLP